MRADPAGGSSSWDEGATTAATLDERVRALLATLIPRFGLDGDSPRIQRAYEVLCDGALDVPLGLRPIRASRLNADGTPFEFALSLGAAPSPLQFLVDPGPRSASTRQRRAITAAAVPELARLLEVDSRAADMLGFLDEFAPAGDADLQADAAGAAWLGVAFSPDARPAMKVYVNAKWGAPERRRAQMLAFSSWFGLGHRWREVESSAVGLEPLGVALTASGDRLRGRAYLAGFGLPFRRYERLAGGLAGPALERRIPPVRAGHARRGLRPSHARRGLFDRHAPRRPHRRQNRALCSLRLRQRRSGA